MANPPHHRKTAAEQLWSLADCLRANLDVFILMIPACLIAYANAIVLERQEARCAELHQRAIDASSLLELQKIELIADIENCR